MRGVKAFLVFPVAALHFLVVPRSPGWDQLMPDPRRIQRGIEGAILGLADILVGELRAIIRLDGLDWEQKRFSGYFQEFYRVLRRMLLETAHKPNPGALINRRPLV